MAHEIKQRFTEFGKLCWPNAGDCRKCIKGLRLLLGDGHQRGVGAHDICRNLALP